MKVCDLIKVTIIGDCNVGKTSIIDKYFNYKNNLDEKANNCTIGAVYWTLDKIIDNEKIKINIWDTAGQEKYNSLIPMYTRSCDILLLTFDLTDKKTLFNLKKWYDISVSKFKMKYIIVGNKSDKENFIQVNNGMIKTFIQNNFEDEIPFILTSALTGENINELFDIILNYSSKISERKKKFVKEENSVINKIELYKDFGQKKNCYY